MSKQLYEEALADVRKVKEVAEADAKRAIIEAVTPRIREMIENSLFSDNVGEEEVSEDEPVVDVAASEDAATPADAITPPDEEGKVTLDLDKLDPDQAGAPVDPPMFGRTTEDEYELSLESLEALEPIIALKNNVSPVDARMSNIAENVKKLSKNSGNCELPKQRAQITKMISHVEDMYDYVQESIVDPTLKNLYEKKLEIHFNTLNKLQEQRNMSKKNRINEADVTLKLTGLPDEIDLEDVGVDLISGDEDADDSDVSGDLDVGDDQGEGSEESDDAGLEDLDLGGDEDTEENEEDMGESRKLSDDTIVEIDEGMLRREIKRMRALREEAVPSVDGKRREC